MRGRRGAEVQRCRGGEVQGCGGAEVRRCKGREAGEACSSPSSELRSLTKRLEREEKAACKRM